VRDWLAWLLLAFLIAAVAFVARAERELPAFQSITSTVSTCRMRRLSISVWSL